MHEIKCQTPQDLEKQSEFYSEYKSHNTFKGLVGISPNVWITFVSTLYGGSISDKEIVTSSSLIDLLEENDLIMADRGFDIQDLLACKKVKLFIPPKRQSKSEQFSKEDCFSTMRIANLRIHVERAIRRIKGWHIFDGVIPLSLCGVVNQLWAVSCLLVNWQKPALTCLVILQLTSDTQDLICCSIVNVNKVQDFSSVIIEYMVIPTILKLCITFLHV